MEKRSIAAALPRIGRVRPWTGLSRKEPDWLPTRPDVYSTNQTYGECMCLHTGQELHRLTMYTTI